MGGDRQQNSGNVLQNGSYLKWEKEERNKIGKAPKIKFISIRVFSNGVTGISY